MPFQAPSYKIWIAVFLLTSAYTHPGWTDCCCSKLPNRYGFDLPEKPSCDAESQNWDQQSDEQLNPERKLEHNPPTKVSDG